MTPEAFSNLQAALGSTWQTRRSITQSSAAYCTWYGAIGTSLWYNNNNDDIMIMKQQLRSGSKNKHQGKIDDHKLQIALSLYIRTTYKCPLQTTMKMTLTGDALVTMLSFCTGFGWTEATRSTYEFLPDWIVKPTSLDSPLVWIHFFNTCSTPYASVHTQVVTNNLPDDQKPAAVVFASTDESVMGRCASVVGYSDNWKLVSIVDSRITGPRLCLLVEAIVNALANAQQGEDAPAKKALIWQAVQERVESWPDHPTASPPDLRVLSEGAPFPVVVAEDGQSVSVEGGQTIVQIVSADFTRRAFGLDIDTRYMSGDEVGSGLLGGTLSAAGMELLSPYMDMGGVTRIPPVHLRGKPKLLVLLGQNVDS
jgi:hypothetical protein